MSGARWETSSLWAGALTGPRRSGRSPSGSHEVVVVGGGLTGLVVATVLGRAGMDVVVLERHGIGGVTSRGSTGKLSALQGAQYPTIRAHRDAAATTDYAAASTFGVAALRALIGELGIDCALTEAADHTFVTEPDALERCTEVLEVASAAKVPVEWVTTTELPVEVLGAVRLGGQAHLDPGALCAGLAARLGDRVFQGCPVTGVDEGRDAVTVAFEGGEVTAQHVVIATLGPIHDPAMLATRCEPMRSYAVAAPHPAPPQDTYISVDSSSRSIRPAQIDGQPAVVVGGEGHVVGEMEGRSSAERWDALERYASALGAGEARYRWVAHDLVPSDGVPFIGRLSPGAERSWVACGFQKWGISTSMVAGDLILGELEQRPRPWAATFDPGRLASSLTKRLADDAARSVRHLVGDRVSELLHRDEPRAPRCTHLGCALAFDDDEQTWDCPCHGSRYDRDGQVVCGPAVTPVALDDLPTS